VAAVFVLVCSSPLLFSSSGFAADFTNGPWLAQVRAHQIQSGNLFTYFVSGSGFGAFTPVWAFYGGPLLTLAGGLTLLLGNNAWHAFDVLGVAAWSSTYGGMYWLARSLRVSRTNAHFPAICVVTSAYWITDAYGRGDWAEFIALSSIPLLIASSVAILQKERLTFGPALAFLAALWIFTGSHDITLLWGTLVLILVLVFLAVFGARAHVRPVSVMRLVLLGALVFGMNAWYLVPGALYSSTVLVNHESVSYLAGLVVPFNSPTVLFDPLRTVPSASTTPALFVQFPVFFLAASLLVLGYVGLRGSRRYLRAASALVAVFVVLTLLIVYAVPTALPKPFSSMQFSYRTVGYVTLVIGFLVIAVALASSSSRSHRHQRVFTGAMVIVSAVSTSLAVWQLWIPTTEQPFLSLPNRAAAIQSITKPPESFYGIYDYDDGSQPLIRQTLKSTLMLPSFNIGYGREAIKVGPDPTTSLIQTTLGGGPQFVSVGGDFRRVGRNPVGQAVIRPVRKSKRAGVLVLSAATGFLFVALRWISSSFTVLGLIVLIVLAGTGISDRLWPRRWRLFSQVLSDSGTEPGFGTTNRPRQGGHADRRLGGLPADQ
jgi:hypothetical protein